AGVCDPAETCTGSSATCPPDALSPAGTSCPDDGNPCTLDQCDGTNVTCQHPAGNAGTVCHTAGNDCDLTHTCTGTSTTCPTPVKAAGTACTDDTNPCTTDTCNGTVGNPLCVHSAGNAGTVCRAATGDCDLAATCTGTTTTCPSNPFKPSGTACPDDGNVCTSDVCSGTSATCTHPAGHAGTASRAPTGPCDPAATCAATTP